MNILDNLIADKAMAITGHRPDKLNGYNKLDNKKLLWELHRTFEIAISEGYVNFYNGLALGVDQWSALTLIKLRDEKYQHIKIHSCIPCNGHPDKWQKPDRDIWNKIVCESNFVHNVYNGEYTPFCMQKRNEFMVNRCYTLLAVYNGDESGGTFNCVEYAKKKLKDIKYINPDNFK